MNRRTNILQTPLVHRSVDKTVGHRATDVDKGVDMLRTRTLSSKKKKNDDTSTAAAAATTTIFEAFTEVALDLTLSFSPQNSPAASTSEVFAPSLTSTPPPPPPRSPSPGGGGGRGGASARPTETTLSRTLSFTTQLRKAKEKSRFSDFLSLQPRSSSSPYRQTVNYTGRGTPVDKNKTRQWGGPFSSSGRQRGVVSEDGLLFSTAPELRATSLDLPRLSSSSDWDFLNITGPSAASGSPRSAKRSVLARSLLEDGEEEEREEEAPPKIEVKLENGVVDWTSVLETALSSAEGGVLSGGGTAVPPPPTILEEGVEERRVGTAVVKEVQSNATTTTTTTIAKTDDDDPRPTEVGGAIPKKQPSLSEVRFDVHVDKALDLGFTPTGNGGTFFDLVASDNLSPGIEHDDDHDGGDDGGRSNPSESSLSQYSTPSEGASDDGPAQQQQQALMKTTTATTAVLSPHCSNGQGKHQGNPVLRTETTPNLYDSVVLSPKVGGGGGLSWWKKGLGKLKRLQVPSRARRSMC